MTQWSESINKFFQDYIDSSTMVSNFVYQYENALNAHYFKEKEYDVRIKFTRTILKMCHTIEEDVALVYIRKSFIIFQNELFNSQW